MTDANKPAKAAKSDVAKPDAATAETGVAPAKAPAAKKEKAPALEDKPFADFVQQDLLPALKTGFTSQGIADVEIKFTKTPVAVSGVTGIPDCWQVVGQWQPRGRQFNLYFFDETLQGQRGFSCTSHGIPTSVIESFLIDERKITLDLLVFGLLQRLNAQKWLQPN